MSNTIEIDGMDEFTKMLEGMTLTQAEESKAMKNALEIPFNSVVANAPIDKGVTKKSIKRLVKKDGLGTVGTIRVDTWTALFTELGTSQDKSHIGWFSNSIEKTSRTFLNKLGEELLSKAK